MKHKVNTGVQLFILLLLFIFSYSFFAKVFDFDKFTADLVTSPLIPGSYINIIRFGVPSIEVLIIILILSPYRHIGFYLAFFSLVIFTTYYILFYRVAESHCGCGKLFESLGFYPHLILNIMLLSGSAFLVFHPFKPGFQK